MKYKTPGHFRSAAEFRDHFRGIDDRFDCVNELVGSSGPMARPVEIAGLKIGNRYAIHPMEGWDGTHDGMPSAATLRRWRNFGRSGAKLIWGGEAFAVTAEGRANPNQLFLNDGEDLERGLTELRGEILEGHTESGLDRDGLVIGLQLTHSGRYARPEGIAAPRTAQANPLLDQRDHVNPGQALLSDGELEGIGERFIRAAVLAQQCGFDFVDVKCCHGYLLHELLGARLRPGQYGGEFLNRTRLVTNIVREIRSESPGLAIGVRLSVTDMAPFSANPETRIGEPAIETPYDCGFGIDRENPTETNLDEPFQIIALLRELGVGMINVTVGVPYYTPHLQRPAAYPPSDGYLPPEDPLVGVQRHLAITRQCKTAFPDMLFVGSGYTYLQEWLAHVAEFEVGAGHVDCVGIGRMVLSYPELPLHALSGVPFQRKRICRTFSDCTTAPRNGLASGCYPLDPYYKESGAAATLDEIKKHLARA